MYTYQINPRNSFSTVSKFLVANVYAFSVDLLASMKRRKIISILVVFRSLTAERKAESNYIIKYIFFVSGKSVVLFHRYKRLHAVSITCFNCSAKDFFSV